MKNFKFSLQSLMYGCLINMIYFISCLYITFNHPNPKIYAGIPMVSVYMVILLLTLISFIRKPQYFGYFGTVLKSFSCMRYHFILYIITIISSVTLILVLPSPFTLTSIIPLIIMLFHNVNAKTFKKFGESAIFYLNLFAMFSSLGYESFQIFSFSEQ